LPIFGKMNTITWLLTAFLCLLFACFHPGESLGQVRNGDGSIDCTEPTLIQVSAKQIQIISSGDYETPDASEHVVFYKESDRYTFWYKIAVSHSCNLQFDIYPSNESDFYNFYLYKYEGSNFCRGIIEKSVVPFRSNLFERTGAGREGGIDKTVKGERMEAVNEDDYYYYRPRKQVIEAVQGDIYYLNVHHLVGDDCGHTVVFSSCEKKLKLEAKHKPCYEQELEAQAVIEAINRLKSIASIASITSTPLEELELDETPPLELDLKVKTEKPVSREELKTFTLKPATFNSKTEQSLAVEYKVIEKASGMEVDQQVNDEGLIQLKLEENTEYTIIYYSLGYESQRTDIRPEEDKREVQLPKTYLKPKGVGTNIVLNNIYFHPNTYVFRSGADAELERLLAFLRGNVNARVEIQGHTNGDYRVKSKSQYAHLGKEWNFSGSSVKLSKLRASAVRNYLTAHGIDAQRLSVTGLGGKYMLIEDPADRQDRLVNMRVEIVILEI